MKLLFSSLFLLFSSAFIFSQNWNQIGTTCYSVYKIKHDASNHVFVGGDFCEVNNNVFCHDIAEWNGSNFQSLANGIHGYQSYVGAIAFLNGYTIAGGTFDTAGNIPAHNIAKWDGFTWTAMGSGTDANVSDLCVFNGKVYVGGNFIMANSISANGLASWNNSWSAVPGWTGNNVISMIVWNNQLCVLTSLGNNTFQFLMFNGNSWTSFPAFTLTDQLSSPLIYSIEIFNGHLFMCGLFDQLNSTPVHSIAEFDGSNWSDAGLTSISYFSNPSVYLFSIKSDGVHLFLGGGFDTINNIPVKNIAMYDGHNWSWFANYNYADALALDICQGDMYAASRSWIYKLDSTLSVNNYNSQKDPIKVYPNPVNDILHFDPGNEKISQTTVYSLAGEKILSQNNSQNNIPVSALPTGTYMIEVRSVTHLYHSLFTKE